MASRFVPLPLAPRAGCAPTLFNSIQASGIERFDYRPELFDWPAAGLPAPGPAATGFCGFRLLYPSAGDGKREDLARFEGDAWQLVGTGSLFGAAALAVGVIDNDGRAQPVPFREFWLVRPAAGARQLRLYALADSPALAAAFQIDLVPGVASRADVQVALYPREGAGKLLLAPLAGSFVQGEHRPGRVLPLQAEVHSVDGLAIHTAAGGWLWRPLDNPPAAAAPTAFWSTRRAGSGCCSVIATPATTSRTRRSPASRTCGWCRAVTGAPASCACSKLRPAAPMCATCRSASCPTSSRHPARGWSSATPSSGRPTRRCRVPAAG